METLQITPIMAQRRSLNFGEYAEEAVIIEEPLKPKKVNQIGRASCRERV